VSSLELGLIGNCQIALLIDARGRYVWGSFPRMDSDPPFCALLDNGDTESRRRGVLEVEMLDLASSAQSYVENTPILTTTLRDEHGNALRFLDFAPRYSMHGRSFHPGTVIRQIVPLQGTPTVRIRVRPASDYGHGEPKITHGSNHIRFDIGDFVLRLTTNASLSAVLEERAFLLEEPLTLVLGPDETLTQSPSKLGREMYGETLAYWQNWSRGLSIPFEWQEEVIRAAITLKLCTFEDTGAVLAALTTSIPEAPNPGRNWDYRFCWLRDAYYVVQALNRLGATRTMEQFIRYLFNVIANGPEGVPPQPVYGISGEPALHERTIDSLPGYRGMGPVRVGNDAFNQVQNDVYGAVVLAATQLFFDRRLGTRSGQEEFRRLEPLGELAAQAFDQPDSGLWEFRGRREVHTYSAVMCWAACDRLARIAERLGLDAPARRWSETAAEMHGKIVAAAWSDERNSFVATFGGDTLDASLLTLADLKFVEPLDPRFLSTLAACEAELKRGTHLFRYTEADDFGMPETAFNICTFWYINALAAVGRKDEARELFDQMLAHRTALGLMSEDVDPRTGELWGNLPQTYSMVGIIMGAMRLSRSWEDAL
jgi:GH15 family glucan-1,4-alpha-glucosidase